MVLSNSYCTNFLPIELEWFNAQYTNQQVILTWKTAQPGFIDRFVIERSNDGSSWTLLTITLANDALSVYNVNDPKPNEGANYYRIKIIKKSGVSSYSAIRRIIVPGKNDVINIFPNPASKKIFISGISSPSQFSMYDQTGKLIFQKKLIASQTIVEVNLPTLSKGIYIIRINDTIRKLIIN